MLTGGGSGRPLVLGGGVGSPLSQLREGAWLWQRRPGWHQCCIPVLAFESAHLREGPTVRQVVKKSQDRGLTLQFLKEILAG